MESLKIQHLLEIVSKVSEKYNELSKVTGENFNIFRILKIESSEVKTHSAFIAELLNTKGSHGCKDIFLKLFLEIQKLKQANTAFADRFKNFETDNSSVTIEKHIGFINKDNTEGGRVDILISDKFNRSIIIENKIYAVDQPNQLVRYNTAYILAPIFYLTLKGASPYDSSKGELISGDNFVSISYENDILQWLEACIKETVHLPILRETIAQYINLLKFITNQTINTNMKNEIAGLMSNTRESVMASYTIRNAVPDMEKELLEKLKMQLREFAEPLGFTCDFEEDFGKSSGETYLGFYLPGQKEIMISIGFDKWRMDFAIGVWAEEIKPAIKEKIINSAIASKIGKSKCIASSFTNWYYIYYFEDRKMSVWDNPEIWCEILDGTLSKQLSGYITSIADDLEAMKLLD